MPKSKQELRLAKKEYDKKRREAMKNDPKKLEELKEKERIKYQKKKLKKQVKNVADMTSREHRIKKKQWKKNSKNYRKKLKTLKNFEQSLSQNSPPLSDEETDFVQAPEKDRSESRKSLGRKKVRRDRSKLFRENEKLKSQLKKAKSRAEKYKKRYQILNKKAQSKSPTTPRSKVKHLLAGEKVSPAVRKKLLFGEVLHEELRDSYKRLKTSQHGRKLYHTVIKGKILKKYRLLSQARSRVLMNKISKSFIDNEQPSQNNKAITVKCSKRGKCISSSIKECVKNFFERDDNSRLCPGKKDCVTKNKTKKQKRLLNNSIKTLFEKFIKEVNFKLSYASFCLLKPFWVVQPHVGSRDTCACLLHTNTEILVSKLNEIRVLEHKKPTDIVKELCCDKPTISCLHRKCWKCRNNFLQYKIDDPGQEVKIKKWVNEVNLIEIKGIKKKVTKPIKKDFIVNVKLLVTEFEEVLPKYLYHIGNIRHQYFEMKKVKEHLDEFSAVVHIDFSENYNCKYSEEIQAVHFGGGRDQITLHTGVIYLKQDNEKTANTLAGGSSESFSVKASTFCSLSKSLRHDAFSVWAHLKPVIEWLFDLNPNLKNIHVQSDGVVTQYRNKTMFYFISNKLRELFPKIEILTWNYSEAGHGKGAPDGVGGTLKRTADRIVAQGKDVENFDSLFNALKENCHGVKMFAIRAEDIDFIENLAKGSEKTKAFQGTLKVHQVYFNWKIPKLYFRSLSCFQCQSKCSHFHMGEGFERPKIVVNPSPYELNEALNEPGTSGLRAVTSKGKKTRLNYKDVYSSSDEDKDTPYSKGESGIQFGSFVLVRFKLKCEDKKKKKQPNIHQFVGITQSCEQNDEIEVMFLKSANPEKTLFFVDDNDVSFVSTNQVVAVLDPPNVVNKGCRLFYKFQHKIPVY